MGVAYKAIPVTGYFFRWVPATRYLGKKSQFIFLGSQIFFINFTIKIFVTGVILLCVHLIHFLKRTL